MPVDVVLEAEYLLRVVMAGLFSAALGWERERAGKAAGFRTHIVVGVTACLFVITSLLAVTKFPGAIESANVDPTRIIHAIAVGIGFLGSGVVFVSRHEDTVKGLTTAASVWATAAVGAASGFGLYLLATGTTVLLLIVLHKFVHLDTSIDAEQDEASAKRYTSGQYPRPDV